MIEPWATTTDPYTNEFNNKYIVVLGYTANNVPEPIAPGFTTAEEGMLYDSAGNLVKQDVTTTFDYEVTGSLSNEAYAHSFFINHGRTLIFPGWKFKSFGAAYGVICDTLEEASLFL